MAKARVQSDIDTDFEYLRKDESLLQSANAFGRIWRMDEGIVTLESSQFWNAIEAIVIVPSGIS